MSENLVSLFDFASAVKNSLQMKYPTAEIAINKVIKNNDECLLGITIREKDSNIAPNVYVNDYYNEYMKEKITVDEVVLSVQQIYNSACKSSDVLGVDIDTFLNKEKLLDKAIIKLLGKESNKEFLKDAVYKTVLDDLAAVVYIYVGSNNSGIMTSKLQQKHFEQLGISLDELFDVAIANTVENFPATVKTMFDTIADMVEDEILCEEIPMFVATNNLGISGATVCLYPKLLADFCKKYGFENLYILPSSINEVIMIADTVDNDIECLKHMVEEVNSTVVDAKDVLSNSVYFYESASDSISKIL